MKTNILYFYPEPNLTVSDLLQKVYPYMKWLLYDSIKVVESGKKVRVFNKTETGYNILGKDLSIAKIKKFYK